MSVEARPAGVSGWLIAASVLLGLDALALLAVLAVWFVSGTDGSVLAGLLVGAVLVLHFLGIAGLLRRSVAGWTLCVLLALGLAVYALVDAFTSDGGSLLGALVRGVVYPGVLLLCLSRSRPGG